MYSTYFYILEGQNVYKQDEIRNMRYQTEVMQVSSFHINFV